MNVLFVGGGGRISLAKRFIEHGCDVFAYEIDREAPIQSVANMIPGKFWADEGVEEHLLDIYSYNQISIAIPLQDRAAQIMAGLDINSPSSDVNASTICLDKKRFGEFCESTSMSDYYPTVVFGETLIEKPRFGFASRGIRVVEYDEPRKEEFVYQRYISGTEYTVDSYFDRTGTLVDAVPRERVVVKGGEVSKSVTVSRSTKLYQQIMDRVELFGRCLTLRGPICFQFMREESTNSIYIIEVNARFGGGAILSLEAGFDMIQMILNEYCLNRPICYEKNSWKENFGMNRYNVEYFYEA